MTKDVPFGFRFVPKSNLEEEVATLLDLIGTRYDVHLPDRFQGDGREFVTAVYDAIRTTCKYSTGWDGYYDVLTSIYEVHYEHPPWVFVFEDGDRLASCEEEFLRKYVEIMQMAATSWYVSDRAMYFVIACDEITGSYLSTLVPDTTEDEIIARWHDIEAAERRIQYQMSQLERLRPGSSSAGPPWRKQ